MNSETLTCEITIENTKHSAWTNTFFLPESSSILAALADIHLDQQLILLIISHCFIYWLKKCVYLILMVESLGLCMSGSLWKQQFNMLNFPTTEKKELERYPVSPWDPTLEARIGLWVYISLEFDSNQLKAPGPGLLGPAASYSKNIHQPAGNNLFLQGLAVFITQSKTLFMPFGSRCRAQKSKQRFTALIQSKLPTHPCILAYASTPELKMLLQGCDKTWNRDGW